MEESEPIIILFTDEDEQPLNMHQNNPDKSIAPKYCARCFHSFCIPQQESDSDSESDESDLDTEDDSLSQIFREDPEDVEELILDEIAEYMKSNPLAIWRASFERDLVKDIATGLFEEWREDDLCEDYDLPEIKEWVKTMSDYYFSTESEMPPRQGGTPLVSSPLKRVSIANKLRVIDSLPTQTQRTKEWYETRYGLLTASNVWKAIGTEAQQNQLIVEKCMPFDKFQEDCARQGNLSPDNPMAWGQKYEPISALIYEKMNATRLGEYGCIVHPKWRFLGASPDGINAAPESPVYGRMVEIKNIVNRNIDGVPLDAYWVQMQIQMEVCDLEECDFVETRIKEFQHKYEFFESTNLWRGVVLTFVPRIKIGADRQQTDQKPFYEYLLLEPLDQTPGQTIETWTQSKKDAYPNSVLLNGTYWGLDQYSCVLVKRNRAWFQAALPHIERIWRTIERERITGCEHRASKKREPKQPQGCVVLRMEPECVTVNTPLDP
jgi:putative phage-type endonuclease